MRISFSKTGSMLGELNGIVTMSYPFPRRTFICNSEDENVGRAARFYALISITNITEVAEESSRRLGRLKDEMSSSCDFNLLGLYGVPAGHQKGTF